MKGFNARAFYRLTKPGIVYGNAFTAVAGYVLGARDGFSFGRFLGTIVGICLVIACGCVLNNVLDRRIDAKMPRTQKRATVTGAIAPVAALVYATILGLSGFGLLVIASNPLTVGLGVVALIFYVTLYGAAKRYSGFGTAVGSISGALPPVAGYTAASGRFDLGAGLLLVVLIVWQMPHFYAIAIYRRDEYKAAGIPLLSVTHGKLAARRRILVYLGLFVLVTPLLYIAGYVGIIYLIAALGLAAGWWVVALRRYNDADINQWARRMFRYSLIIVMAMPVLIAVGRFLP
jgi:protoheme IX farnesyltransferase